MSTEDQDRLDLPMDSDDFNELLNRESDPEFDDTMPSAAPVPETEVDRGFRDTLKDQETAGAQLDDSRPETGATPESPTDEEHSKGFGEYIKEKYDELKDDLD